MRQSKPYRRRGSMYVPVLGCAMIVTVIGLSALTVTRIERTFADGTADFARARLYAQSAIEMGMLRIKNDPDWRTTYPNGVWETDRPIGEGTYTLEGIDPDDNNLKDLDTDPVLLTGIGVGGDARYKLQLMLLADAPALSCLGVALHAHNDLNFDGAALACDQLISANNSVNETASFIDSNVEAVNTITGTGYTGTTTTGIDPRTMPDPAKLFEFYKTEGTWISIGSIGTVSGVPTIAENVIGPGYNPYGDHSVNPDGIYVIDCQAQDIQIRNSRIFGTLVLLNVGTGSAVYESINWEPAIPNYPALLVSGSMNLIFTNTPLSESEVLKTLNPVGAPYEGVEEGDTDDTYPSLIKGLVYVSANVTTDTSAPPIDYLETVSVTIDGVMVIGNTLYFTNALMDLTYRQTFLDNPPPGFTGTARMLISQGTWRQVVD